jgi:alpha-galactosidase
MIERNDTLFGLHGTQYSMLLRINKYGLPELLHFGEPVYTADADAFACVQGLGWGESILLDEKDTASCPDAMMLAWSGAGRGDYRETPLELGGCAADFRYTGCKLIPETVPMTSGLPQAHGHGETLLLSFAQDGAELLLYFTVFETALTRRAGYLNGIFQSLAGLCNLLSVAFRLVVAASSGVDNKKMFHIKTPDF